MKTDDVKPNQQQQEFTRKSMKYTLEKNKYRIVLLAAQRAKQLQHGALARVRLVGAKATRVALAEIQEGLIGYDFIPDKKSKR